MSAIILASNSPRRASLLKDAGYSFEVMAPDPDGEGDPQPGESAEALVARLAQQKARQIVEHLRQTTPASDGTARNPAGGPIIVAADTVAECRGEILGKPRDREHARRMLGQLRGHPHRVVTGVCVWKFPDGPAQTQVDVTELQMDPLEDRAIDEYLDTGRWRGKAGAFGYQDGNDWVHILRGSPSNVVGLPLELLRELLSTLTAQR